MPFPRPRKLSEFLGLSIGICISPLFALGSALRRQRIFHPEGICFSAQVTPIESLGGFADLTNRLSGFALVRLSAGFWRKNRRFRPDVLGFSIRFGVQPPMNTNNDHAQDVLMASSRSLWTLLVDSLRTNRRDFLRNTYYGMSCFNIDGHSGCLLRVKPLECPGEGENRFQCIRNAVGAGHGRYILEVCSPSNSKHWQPLVLVELQEEAIIDEQDLLFTPFNAHLGIHPEGFIQFLRYAPYLASRWARNFTGDLTGTEHYSSA